MDVGSGDDGGADSTVGDDVAAGEADTRGEPSRR